MLIDEIEILDCIANFIGNICQVFNNKEYLIAYFIDIYGAFD